MRRAILSAALAIGLLANGAAEATPYGKSVTAQDKPNFAGKWRASGSFNLWTITVEGSKMTVTMTVAGNSDSTVYMLDGTPSTTRFDGPAGPMETVYLSTWEGDVLVTTITAPAMTRIERRSIEADGTMKVQSTITILQGKPAPPPPPGAMAPMVFKKVG